VQAELWESRPVWDRPVYPAIGRVFSFRRSPGDSLSITDPSGSATLAAAPRAMPVSLELGNTNRVTASGLYFVHVIATIGTLAQREADEVGDAVFGRESETNSLGSLGRLVFRSVLKLNDYLQSVSAEVKGRRISGKDILRP
jgi:hypothetical protein